MTTTGLQRFQLVKRGSAGFLQQGEHITAVGGHGSRLLLGTNQSRIYRFIRLAPPSAADDSQGHRAEEHNQGSGGGEAAVDSSGCWIIESKAEVQEEDHGGTVEIQQLLCISALGLLLCLTSDGRLHTIDLDNLESLGAGGSATPTSASVSKITLNSHPEAAEGTLDDPFSARLALAVSLSTKQGQRSSILLSTQHASGELKVERRIRLDQVPSPAGPLAAAGSVQTSATQPPKALCYSGQVVCYADSRAYYVVGGVGAHAISETPPLKLFEFCQQQMAHPIVLASGRDEFCLLASSNMAVFVNSEGSSTRPPLILDLAPPFGASGGGPADESTAAMQLWGTSLLAVLSWDGRNLAIFDLDGSELVERVPINAVGGAGSALLADVDGLLLVVGRDGEIQELVRASAIHQINTQLHLGHLDEALEMVNDAMACVPIQHGHDGDDIEGSFLLLQLAELKRGIAYALLKKPAATQTSPSHWAKVEPLLLESEADPARLLEAYPQLRTGRGGESASEKTQEKEGEEAGAQIPEGYPNYAELKDYLGALLSPSWSLPYRRTVVCALAKLHFLTQAKSTENSDLAEFSLGAGGIGINEWNTDELRHWLMGYSLYAKAASAHFHAGHIHQALRIWRRLAEGDLSDSGFDLRHCVHALQQLPTAQLLGHFADTEWLANHVPAVYVAEIVGPALRDPSTGRGQQEPVVRRLIELLGDNEPDLLLGLIEEWLHILHDPSIHNLFFRLLKAGLTRKDSPQMRLKLRHFLVSPNRTPLYDRSWVRRELEGDQHGAATHGSAQPIRNLPSTFKIELMLLQAIESPSSTPSIIQQLMAQGEDEVALLLCSKFPSTEAVGAMISGLTPPPPPTPNHPVISNGARGSTEEGAYYDKLLSILSLAKSTADFPSLLITQLERLPAEAASHQLIERLLVPAAASCLSTAMDRSFRSEIGKKAVESSKKRWQARSASTFFRLDHDTLCHVCRRPIVDAVRGDGVDFAEPILRHPAMEILIHQRCYERS